MESSSNAKIMGDFRSVTVQMDNRVKAIEEREKGFTEGVQKAKDRIVEARRKIAYYHEARADRDYRIERCDIKIRAIDSRLKSIEQNIEITRNSMRYENRTSDVLIHKQKELKEAFQKQSELQAKIIRSMRRKDQLQNQLDAAMERDSKLRERVEGYVGRLKVIIAELEEKKKIVRNKVQSIRASHAGIFEMEPKLRETYTRMRKIEVVVFDLQDRINRKEEEVKKVERDIHFTKEEHERTYNEWQVKKEKKYRGPEALKQLTVD